VTFLHRATTSPNLSDVHASTLTIQLDEFNLPVVAPTTEKQRDPNPKAVGVEIPLKNLTKDQSKQFEGLLACDILKELSGEDQNLLWTMRHHLVRNSGALGKFLQCVNWGKVEDRMEAYRLLRVWATPVSGVSALELLDAKFPDPVVRAYAIDMLRGLRDDELRNYLLQLVQCLKFEPYHDSPLKRFLIERALANPMNVGHYFFWHLKAEVHAPFCCERFGLILEEYLSFAGRFTLELKKQASAVLKLQRIAEMVVRLKRDHGYSDPEAMKEYSKECEKVNALTCSGVVMRLTDSVLIIFSVCLLAPSPPPAEQGLLPASRQVPASSRPEDRSDVAGGGEGQEGNAHAAVRRGRGAEIGQRAHSLVALCVPLSVVSTPLFPSVDTCRRRWFRYGWCSRTPIRTRRTCTSSSSRAMI
jgi:hypothetical protein